MPLRYSHNAEKLLNSGVLAEGNIMSLMFVSYLAELTENNCFQVMNKTESASLGPNPFSLL